jgi:Leucine-rich repeat (LRR) protein
MNPGKKTKGKKTDYIWTNRLHAVLNICLAFFLGLSLLFIALFRHSGFVMFTRVERFQYKFLLLPVFIIFVLFLYFMIDRISEFNFRDHVINKYALISIVLGSLVTVLIYKTPPFPLEYDLQIKPVVVENAPSPENGVHIVSIAAIYSPGNDERLLSSSEFGISGNWTIGPNDDSFTFMGTGIGLLEYHQSLQGYLRIVFETSPTSGSVILSLNRNERIIDLSAQETGTYVENLELPFTFSAADRTHKAMMVALILAELFSICMGFLLPAILVDQVFILKAIHFRGFGTLLLVVAVSLSMVFLINYLEKEVAFPDENLETAIREVIGNSDKPIYYQQLQTIAYLDITGQGIYSLEGLENLKNLIELHADFNYIKDLTPLSTLKHLRSLSLRGNKIIDLQESNFDALAGLPIKILDLSKNADLSPDFFETRLSDISSLSRLSLLEELYLENNDIRDISTIGGLSELRILNLRSNLIAALPDLCALTSLEELDLRENRLSAIDALRCLANLKELNLQSNGRITSIEALQNLVNLTRLDLEDIPIGGQLRAIEPLIKLVYLDLSNCGLTDISTLDSLMARGALQDNKEQQVFATLILRDNLLLLHNPEALATINKYWNNITYRDPAILPQVDLPYPPPRFSRNGGLYEDAFSLELDTDAQDVSILYTLDGSEPNIDNVNYSNALQRTYIYKAPITVKSRVGDANVFSLFVTADDVREWIPKWYPPKNEVFKVTVVRARAYDPRSKSYSKTVTNTYLVDKNIFSRYEKLPIISLVADYKDLFDPDFGIYTPGILVNQKISLYAYSERIVPANIEFFEVGGEPGFKGLYEISLQGSTTRSNPQKGLNVVVNEWFGEGPIKYPLFAKSGSKANQLTEFNRFILRSWGSSRDWPMIFSDAYHQTLLAGADIEIQDYRPVIVFLNGEYWGLHEIRQAIKNPDYFSSITGVDPLNPGFDILYSIENIVDEGDSENWEALVDFIKDHDLGDAGNYQYVSRQVDIDNFILYVIHCTFTGKRDWPGHNEGEWRVRSSDGKWRWFQFDMDHGLSSHGRPSYDMLAQIVEGGAAPHPLFIALLKNKDFRTQFINTYADYLNSYFLTAVELEHFQDILNEIEPYMPEYQDRWQLNQAWEDDKEYALSIIDRRASLRLAQLIKNFNLAGTYQLSLHSDPSQGSIKVNSILINGDLPGVTDPASWSGLYFDNIPVNISAIPLAGYTFDQWESNAEIDAFSSDLMLDSQDDVSLTAVFIKK